MMADVLKIEMVDKLVREQAMVPRPPLPLLLTAREWELYQKTFHLTDAQMPKYVAKSTYIEVK